MSDAQQVMTGMIVVGEVMPVVLGQSTDPQAVQTMAMVLTGHHDQTLAAAFFYRDTGRYAGPADLELPSVLLAVERLKTMIRQFIQGVLNAVDAAEEARKHRALQQTLEELRAHNQPHPEGTVNQLAAKYGVSKSEIRRRKAAGTLHELQPVKKE